MSEETEKNLNFIEEIVDRVIFCNFLNVVARFLIGNVLNKFVHIQITKIMHPCLHPMGPTGGLENGKDVGLLLFGDYLVPFELLSVLLLGAVFGALLIARKDRPE